ncbi:hypothetical protein IM720_24345 [Pseudomonas fluorescens]|uniref:Uncharacterized protein n=1 Tax=Pseudomonas fluorescens TaxID=294 RepID=A0A7M2J464_PSEFL|nr:hypothetical protein [Pseudomonas fluorescens]QOU03806.1 hypothetical protein IM720_24345 [Pseudomonas fluorescens]
MGFAPSQCATLGRGRKTAFRPIYVEAWEKGNIGNTFDKKVKNPLISMC